MKKFIVLLTVIALASFTSAPATISKKERKSASSFLKDSEKNVLQAIGNLSDEQLKFKPGPDKWSVQDCMMHIAASEKMLWGMTEQNIKAAANPEKRSEIKMTDEDVMKNVADRTNKVKTFQPLEPQNTGYTNINEAVASFRENRGKLISYVKSTQEDLRSHVAALPIGSFDCYQMLLFIGAHSNRHVAQMREVMADPAFPKK
jgi:uncharacterized damage-inducible protein DinB